MNRQHTLLIAIVLLMVWGIPGCKKQELQSSKFNVAFIYVGPVGDGGWTYAHNEGRKYLEANVDGVHTDYLENVSEGAEAERLIRSMARKGYNLIITTSFGFMDAAAAVAEEFPDTKFISVTGFRSNEKNLANLMGAMENMRYLAGMIAGARAKEDGEKIIGAVEPIPIPEVIRLTNAFALGVKETCSECEVHLRWTQSWYDPAQERAAAESLLNAGAHVIATGCDTTGPVVAAAVAGKWGIGYDSRNACREAPERCLTTSYWNWGPTYARMVKEMIDGTWKPGNYYLGEDADIVGLLGVEEGQTPREFPSR